LLAVRDVFRILNWKNIKIELEKFNFIKKPLKEAEQLS